MLGFMGSQRVGHDRVPELNCEQPGSPEVKNPPANSGDADWIPDPGRSHSASEQPSQCATTLELELWSPDDPQQEDHQ